MSWPQPTRRVVSIAASEVRRAQTNYLVAGVPLGHLSLLIGVQGLGKSQYAAWLAAAASRGEFGRPAASLICSAEDAWDTTIKPRLEAWQADLDLVRFVKIQLDDGDEDGLCLPDDAESLSDEIAAFQAALVVIDPVVAHLAAGVDSHRDHSTRMALRPLARLAAEHACAVLGLHHLNKGVSSDPLNRASASLAFTAAARSVLLFARDPDDPEGELGSGRALAHVKCNLAPLAPTGLYTVEPILLPATASEPEVETSRVRMVGTSEHSGRDLLRAAGMLDAGGEGMSAVDEAKAFLLSALEGGPRPVDGLKKEAKAAGLSERSLERAKTALEIKSERAGGIGAEGRWSWVLTKTAKQVTALGGGGLSEPSDNGSTMRVSGAPDLGGDPKAANSIALAALADHGEIPPCPRHQGEPKTWCMECLASGAAEGAA
jgi:hypothetical protein